MALPKGRILQQLAPLLVAAGVEEKVLLGRTRKLVREAPNVGLSFLLLKPDDVPTYVEFGAADLGVVGRDVLMERDYDLYVPLELGLGRCRMMVCGRPGASLSPREGRALRVATKFPQIATRHFAERGQPVEVIFVQGSVELAPLMGLADLIVDLVETGETLRQNGLEELEWICDISSVIVANRVGLKLERERIAPLLGKITRALEG